MAKFRVTMKDPDTMYEERNRLWQAAEAKLSRVAELLLHNGCDCDCGCDSDGHDDACDVCLACLVSEALR